MSEDKINEGLSCIGVAIWAIMIGGFLVLAGAVAANTLWEVR